MDILYYILIVVAAIVNTAGQVFLKLGAEEFSFEGGLISILKTSWKLIVGLFFFGLTFILSTILNKKLDVSFVYPIMTGLTFLLISVVMVLFLKKETVSLMKGFGMFVIISGILLMSFAKK
jgi:multidrug transporter EmrE-like cation transporter